MARSAEGYRRDSLGRAVDLRNAFDPGLCELLEQVAGGIGELGEDEDLLSLRVPSTSASRMSFLSLSSCRGSNFLASSRKLTIWSRSRKVSWIISTTSYSSRSRRRRPPQETLAGRCPHLVFVVVVVFPKLELAVRDVVEHLRVLVLSIAQGASSRLASRYALRGTRAAFCSRRSQDSSNAATELSKRLRNSVRMRPTTCFWRFCSNGSMLLSSPL